MLSRKDRAGGEEVPLTPLEFDNLVCVADALLDPDGWSAGYTAVNAVAFGLPIVCRPGAVARTRQSAAILTLLGETRTIAASASAYVEIVERIARAWMSRRTFS